MKSQRPTEIELFNAALEIDNPEQRERYLSDVCGGNTALHSRLGALLDSHTRGIETFESLVHTFPKPNLTTDLRPGERVGQFQIVEKLGEGGCGVVYVAEQNTPVRRRVALKVIKAGMDTRNVIARFEAERQALAMMDHPNIAKVFEAGSTDQGRPYFAMELVQGERITCYCDRNKVSLRTRLELFLKVCQAAQHAHQKGIIHRDLKPSNILVTADTDRGRDKGCTLPLPPNRTGGFPASGSPVSGLLSEFGSLGCGLRLRRSARGLRSKRLASVDDLVRARGLAVYAVCAEACAAVAAQTDLPSQRHSAHCGENS